MEQLTKIKCCLCRECVLPSGWCPNCQRWPLNITPRRWCERAHPVDVDGFCSACNAILLNRLEPGNAEWRDTGKVDTLLPRQENLRRCREITAMLGSLGPWTRTRQVLDVPEPTERTYRDIVADERWAMEESHWRARWNLARRDPQYRAIGEAIPERLRVQFAVEDQMAEEAKADREKPADPHPGGRAPAVPF